jgi:pimeloyl-ACP methyl ester carboxylesterase
MIDERALIARLEAADPDTLATLLQRPSVEEEQAYRAYLGDERYDRMHGLALQRGRMRSVQPPQGNVVVIHGIMGGELTAFRGGGNGDRIWAQIARLALGRIGLLRLDEAGTTEHAAGVQVRATGIMKRYYGELALSLARNWRVETFWFDWRKDLNLAAAELHANLNWWFGGTEPVHIVAHSMGGLVARTMIKNYPDRWARMWDEEGNGRRGGRLLMLGTPNQGSFAVPQILTGIEGMVRKLALVDLRHNLAGLCRIVNSFPGSYQMMPSPRAFPEGSAEQREVMALYDARTYAGFPVSQAHLDAALRFHGQLYETHRQLAERKRGGKRELGDLRRMVYVAGFNQPTLAGVEPRRVSDRGAYRVTAQGDGRVPHRLGVLDEVPMYYIEEDHGALSTNATIMESLDSLLESGRTDRLSTTVSGSRSLLSEEDARVRMEAAEERDREMLQLYVRQAQRTRGVRPSRVHAPGAARTRGDAAGAEPATLRPAAAPMVPSVYVSPSERMAEEVLTRGFLTAAASLPSAADRRAAPPAQPTPIEIRLRLGGIEDASFFAESEDPVDAVAVGHYQGVQPVTAELALDRAISAAQAEVSGAEAGEGPGRELLITQLAERGTIRGDLGQVFLLPDPRAAESDVARVVAVAGMGLPGRFGIPELTVLVRELAWALGRIGKRHLASVLIGSGNGNLTAEDAVASWVRGLERALGGAVRHHLRRLTLVEHEPQRVLDVDAALTAHLARAQQRQRLAVTYTALTPEQRRELEIEAADREIRRLEERARTLREQRDGGAARAREEAAQACDPTRLTVALEGGTYHFGAITATAAIPEREIPLDPELVREANEELVAAPDLARQREHGRFLEKLLLPGDLRDALSTPAPLVLLLDATTARIQWEMMAQPEVLPSTAEAGAQSDTLFLGTHRGLTRQLRTTFAPPPEPPPPPRRVLRVLVVADPAEDAHLPGAEEEGIAVAELFESFNEVHSGTRGSRVEVVRLFGPRQATRTNVLRHLALHSYDVLHFAGHCVYTPGDPAGSGWVFSKGQIVSARELDRIDRVPNFVFSNACESGITPDRAEKRSTGLAPSFAEAFFKRGVVNFVCTAWPVDDLAARSFALELYRHLLGIRISTESGIARFLAEHFEPAAMHVAMREARLVLARSAAGLRTWGAYQHYGNPNFRFFAPQREAPSRATSDGAEPGAASGGAPSAPPVEVLAGAAVGGPEVVAPAAPGGRARRSGRRS